MTSAFKEMPPKEWLTSVRFMAYYFTLKHIILDSLIKKLTLRFWATNNKDYVAFEFLGFSDISVAMQDAHTTKIFNLKEVSTQIEKKLTLCWFEKMTLAEGDNAVQITITDGYNHHQITVQDSEEVFFHDQDHENDLWPSEMMW